MEGREGEGEVLTTCEWCDPVRKMSHHIKKGVECGEGIAHERFENSGGVWAGIQ